MSNGSTLCLTRDAMTDHDYPYAPRPEAKTWQPEWPIPRATVEVPVYAPPLALIVAGVMLILTSGNFMLMPIAKSINPSQAGFLLGICCLVTICGSLGAQAALLTILMTFGAGPLWQRLLWHWGLAAMALAAWCLGFAIVDWNWISSSNFDSREFVSAVCALPLIALACQSFPWFLRIYFRCRIECLPARAASASGLPLETPFLPRPANSSERITIRDFLLGTVLVAVTMAVVRLGKPASVGDAEFWGVMSGISAAAVGLTVLGTLPICCLVLAVRELRFALCGVLAIGAAAVTIMACLLLFVPGGPTGMEKSLIAVALVGGFIGVLAGTLGLARWYGYRLVRT
jgi:hypothetical protein